MAVDWSNPCTRALELRKAYYALLSGDKQAGYQYQAEGVLRSVTWAKTDLETLKTEIAAAEAECAAANGGVSPEGSRTKRFAIKAGSRRF